MTWGKSKRVGLATTLNMYFSLNMSQVHLMHFIYSPWLVKVMTESKAAPQRSSLRMQYLLVATLALED